MVPMANIGILLNCLQNNQWHITAFQFTYKNIQYIVLFEDISNLPLVSNKYIVLLTFIDRNNKNHILQTKANLFKFEIDAKKFREYFGIAYTDNLRDIFLDFYSRFNNCIPQTLNQNFDDETKLAVLNKLSRNDKEDANNLCCYAAKRNGIYNGIQHHRTPFNSDKTKLLREDLFNMLGSDDTISFCYRAENPLDDVEIYEKFAQQYGII